MTDLQALHQALSEAECGGRELDFEIARQVCGLRDSGLPDWMRYDDDAGRYIGVEAVPAFTTDLSAITSLIERVLPGWAILVSWRDGYAVCDIHTHALGDFDGLWPAHESAQTPALALAKSLVSALIAQEGEK